MGYDVGGVCSRAALRNQLLLDGRRWRRTWFFELLWRIDITAVRRRMPMPSPHSEQAVSEHIASRRSWRNLLYRSFFSCIASLTISIRPFEHRLPAQAHGARASQAVARPRICFSLAFPKRGVRALDEL